jgi:hypothetical protein
MENQLSRILAELEIRAQRKKVERLEREEYWEKVSKRSES